jgi:hypothetical protein
VITFFYFYATGKHAFNLVTRNVGILGTLITQCIKKISKMILLNLLEKKCNLNLILEGYLLWRWKMNKLTGRRKNENDVRR